MKELEDKIEHLTTEISWLSTVNLELTNKLKIAKENLLKLQQSDLKNLEMIEIQRRKVCQLSVTIEENCNRENEEISWLSTANLDLKNELKAAKEKLLKIEQSNLKNLETIEIQKSKIWELSATIAGACNTENGEVSQLSTANLELKNALEAANVKLLKFEKSNLKNLEKIEIQKSKIWQLSSRIEKICNRENGESKVSASNKKSHGHALRRPSLSRSGFERDL